MEGRRYAHGVLVGRHEGRVPHLDGRVILKWIFKEWD
jgi:hypothetical protein